MSFILIAAIFIIFALLLAYFASKILFKQSWFLGWLRGMIGLGFLVGVCGLVLMALDVMSYRQLESEENIATISFTAIAPQEYSANFVDSEGVQQNFTLYGDQWQLDSRIIKWETVLSRLGLKTGFRLERISGRYLLLDDERTKARSVFDLKEEHLGVDVWSWIRKAEGSLVVDAIYGNSAFLPMVDGGQYQISVSLSGLLARPLNEPAKLAVEQWR